MGKHQRVRKSKRPDPLARKTAQDEKIVNEKILPLLNQLKSPKPTDRAVAIGALNAMTDDPKLRRMLMKEKALQTILAHTLTDSSQEITSESYGFLRNVVLEEGRDVAIFLYRQNILTSVSTALQKLVAAWDESMEKLTGQDRATVIEFGENLLGLLTGMVLGDDAIYDAVVESMADSGITLAAKMLATDMSSAIDTAMEFLYALSEDNPEIALKLRDLPTKSETVSSRVYSVGIRYNLYEATNEPLLPVLKELVDLLNSVDSSSLENIKLDNMTDPAELKAATIRMTAVRSQINAIQVSIELFAAITETLAESEEPEALEFSRDVIIPLCLEAANREEFAFRALTALNNLGWTLNATGTPWEAAAEQMWVRLVPLVQNDDIDIASAAVGALSAVSKCFDGSVPIEQTTVVQLLNRCTALKTPETKEEFMQFAQPAIGLLASVASVSQNLEIVSPLTDILLEILSGSSDISLPLLIDSIDALFEIFGDNDTPSHSIYQQKQVNHRLQEALPTIKRSLKSIEKSKNPALWEQANDALLNLTRFIEYKA